MCVLFLAPGDGKLEAAFLIYIKCLTSNCNGQKFLIFKMRRKLVDADLNFWGIFVGNDGDDDFSDPG